MTFYEFAEKYKITCEALDFDGGFTLELEGRKINGKIAVRRKADVEDALHMLHLVNRGNDRSFREWLKKFLGPAYVEFEDCYLG